MKVFILSLGYIYDGVDKILAFDSSAKAKEWCKNNLGLSKSKWTKLEDCYLYEGKRSQGIDVPCYTHVTIRWLDVL